MGKRFPVYIICVVLLISVFSLSLGDYAFGATKPAWSSGKGASSEKLDLRKYFQKAMSLFETNRYKEAIILFERLIEIETSQNRPYFTPFAEIYIEKARARMDEMIILEDKRWERMKEEVISEEEQRIVEEQAEKEIAEKKAVVAAEEGVAEERVDAARAAKERAARIAREKRKRLLREREEKRRKAREERRRKAEQEKKIRAIEQAKKKEALKLAREVRKVYNGARRYYSKRNYPLAIIEFKKVKEMDPKGRLASHAERFIQKALKRIKNKEEKELLARMEAAKKAKEEAEAEAKRRAIEKEKAITEKKREIERARVEKERQERKAAIEKERQEQRARLERKRKEKEKARIKEIFEARLKERTLKQRISKIEGYMDEIRARVKEQRFEKAQGLLDKAIAEFPENERFKDILHYVEIQKLKVEEKALERAREITEEKMLLEVAKKHLLPEEKEEGVLKKKKKGTPLVRVPEIRKRLKIPISVDFKDVELDYVLTFLSDATDVNIVFSSEIDMEEKKVSIKIQNMPLEEALRYILKAQDLVYRIEEDAVWVATKKELENEKIDTRVYFLNQGVGRFAEFAGDSGERSEGAMAGEVKTVKDVLENAVDWPKDSKLTLDERTGALIISNIPSNLSVIENLLYSLDVTPVQVLIEARFLEVQVTDIDELGLEWKLNSDWGATQNNDKQNKHGFASGSGVDFSTFSRSDEGFNLTYQGILSHPQFQVVMHALKEKQNVKTLSAPRITTLNNQAATIEVIDEYIYPTRYEVSLVQYDINGDGDFDDAGETEWANIPQDFVTRDVGILLHVKPSVGVDNKTITLALTPEVSEDSGSFTYSGDVSIPQFKTRNLSTSVIVESGETVVLGGLTKETKTDVATKVPLLGDLPLVGGLFRKNTENVERRNLLIFVTASILNKDKELAASASEI